MSEDFEFMPTDMAEQAAIAHRLRRLVALSLFAPAPRFVRLRRQMARPAVLARWQRWLAKRRPAWRSPPGPSASAQAPEAA